MIKVILLVAAAAVGGVLIFAGTQPDTFRIERSVTIAAPPEKIAEHIADFRRWSAWSPFERIDPAMKRVHAGAVAGKGAVYSWEGNSKAGAGRMEIVDASNERVTIRLDFTKPFPANNVAEFTLVPNGNATTVTWAMHGPQPFINKVICLFVDMDEMVGKEFENGLASLQRIAERNG